MADPIDLTEARQRIAAENTAKLHQLERELVRVIDGIDPIPPHLDKEQVVANLTAKVEEARAAMCAPEPSAKEQVVAVLEDQRSKVQAVVELVADGEATAEEVEAVFGVSISEPESSGEKQAETEASSVTPSRG